MYHKLDKLQFGEFNFHQVGPWPFNSPSAVEMFLQVFLGPKKNKWHHKNKHIGIQQINEIFIHIYQKDAKGSNQKQQILGYSIFSIEIY